MSRTPILVVLLTATLTGAADAQDAKAWRDSLTRLSAEVAALADSLVARDSTVIEIERTAGVVLSATPSSRAVATSAFRFFQEQRALWFGSAAPSPGGFRLVVQIIPEPNVFIRFGALREEARLVLTGLPDTTGAVRTQRAAAMKDLGNQLLSGFAEMMFPTLGVPTTQWLGNPPPLYMTVRDRRALAMYMVMTSTGKAERGCVNGSVEDCGYALGLHVAPSSDLTGAYPPLVRADLFLEAIEIGGPDAWARVVAAHPVRPEEALVAASGLSADSLMTRWRIGILALRPDVRPLRLRNALLAAGWVGVLLLGTLGASRWR
jgi:hypothetical protein